MLKFKHLGSIITSEVWYESEVYLRIVKVTSQVGILKYIFIQAHWFEFKYVCIQSNPIKYTFIGLRRGNDKSHISPIKKLSNINHKEFFWNFYIWLKYAITKYNKSTQNGCFIINTKFILTRMSSNVEKCLDWLWLETKRYRDDSHEFFFVTNVSLRKKNLDSWEIFSVSKNVIRSYSIKLLNPFFKDSNPLFKKFNFMIFY